MRSHLFLLPDYILSPISPSCRKAARIPDSKAFSLLSLPILPYPSFKVRAGVDPEIEITALLYWDIDVKEDGIKNGLWMYF